MPRSSGLLFVCGSTGKYVDYQTYNFCSSVCKYESGPQDSAKTCIYIYEHTYICMHTYLALRNLFDI